jgi:hypothetical protein
MAKRSPDKAAFQALDEALAAVRTAAGGKPSPAVIRRIRKGLAAHADAVEEARSITDPVRMPRSTFDPSDPKVVGRMVSIALLAQDLVPLNSIQASYGAGVYAIYYKGDHPLYSLISGTETPIYVGKADPASGDASTPREQGIRLTGRLIEHAETIRKAEEYQDRLPKGLHPIRLDDFYCRRLVCATNAQLVAEKHLIRTFWPVWNSDTKACWGMSKHGDAASTRKNKRSPWDVVHPGRAWALDSALVDSLSPKDIADRINEVLTKCPPRRNHAELLEEMLGAFRQEKGLIDDTEQSPLGAGVSGEDPDEAGETDD